MGFLDNAIITAECPLCEYPMDIPLESVRLEGIVDCPCCKASIQLGDDKARVHAASRQTVGALAGLTDSLHPLSDAMTVEF